MLIGLTVEKTTDKEGNTVFIIINGNDKTMADMRLHDHVVVGDVGQCLSLSCVLRLRVGSVCWSDLNSAWSALLHAVKSVDQFTHMDKNTSMINNSALRHYW